MRAVMRSSTDDAKEMSMYINFLKEIKKNYDKLWLARQVDCKSQSNF